MREAVFLFGMAALGAAAVWEHPRWSRVLLVISVLLMLLALAPMFSRLLFS